MPRFTPATPQVPLLVGTATAKALLALRDTRHHEAVLAGNGDASDHADAPPQEQVTLRWRNISCTLTSKHGEAKQLLSVTGASARPGR